MSDFSVGKFFDSSHYNARLPFVQPHFTNRNNGINYSMGASLTYGRFETGSDYRLELSNSGYEEPTEIRHGVVGLLKAFWFGPPEECVNPYAVGEVGYFSPSQNLEAGLYAAGGVGVDIKSFIPHTQFALGVKARYEPTLGQAGIELNLLTATVRF